MKNMPKRRAVKDIPIRLDAKFWDSLRNLVDSIQWPYESSGKQYYQLRDQALASLIILSGLRISEILGDAKNENKYKPLHKKDFTVYDEEVVLNRVITEKHGKERTNIAMPLTGNLSYFTERFKQWLDRVPSPESVVFPKGRCSPVHLNKKFESYFIWDKALSRKRYFKIVKATLDKFPHWFRAICETIYGRLIFNNDPYKLRDFMGVKTIEATVPYVEAEYEKDIPKIYKL